MLRAGDVYRSEEWGGVKGGYLSLRFLAGHAISIEGVERKGKVSGRQLRRSGDKIQPRSGRSEGEGGRVDLTPEGGRDEPRTRHSALAISAAGAKRQKRPPNQGIKYQWEEKPVNESNSWQFKSR